jgi:hypothetical protein
MGIKIDPRDPFVQTVMNMSDERLTKFFADMGIEIDLSKPFPQGAQISEEFLDDDEGYLLDEY